MGYIYEGMDSAKENKCDPIWGIIDRRWKNQLHNPIHAATCYLNPAYCFREDFKTNEEVFSFLYTVISKMAANATDILLEMDAYNIASGPIFSSQICKEEVDPESKWITKATDPVLDDEDLEWVDEVDREFEVMAMAAGDQRATVVPNGTSQALTKPETTVDPRGTS